MVTWSPWATEFAENEPAPLSSDSLFWAAAVGEESPQYPLPVPKSVTGAEGLRFAIALIRGNNPSSLRSGFSPLSLLPLLKELKNPSKESKTPLIPCFC